MELSFMKFKELAYGDIFEVPTNSWPDIRNARHMKVVSTDTYLNAVFIEHWRAGTLDYVHDETTVVFIRSTKVD